MFISNADISTNLGNRVLCKRKCVNSCYSVLFYPFRLCFILFQSFVWYKLKPITVGWILWSFILLINIVFWTISNAINISIKFGLNMLKNQYENESTQSRKLLLIYLPYNFMLLAKKCIQLIGKTNANSLNRCSKCEPFFECHITYNTLWNTRKWR